MTPTPRLIEALTLLAAEWPEALTDAAKASDVFSQVEAQRRATIEREASWAEMSRLQTEAAMNRQREAEDATNRATAAAEAARAAEEAHQQDRLDRKVGRFDELRG